MDSEVTKTDLHLQELKEPKEETPSSKPQITTDLPLQEPKEEPTPIAESATTTTELPLQEPKDLGNSKIEEVRVESVDVNTQTVTDDAKPKSPSYLEKKIETVKKFFLYYTSCSVKKTEPNNNEPK
jgi:hypothetical protein